MSTDSKIYLVGAASVVVLLAVLAFAYYWAQGAIPALQRAGTAATTSYSGMNLGNASSAPAYVIKQVPLPTVKDIMPSLDREVTFDPSVPADVQEKIREGVANTEAILKKDPTNGDAWLNLGVLYHTAGDLEGAKEVWLFLTQADPHNSVAFDNLGKLYQFDTPDYPKAESYFKAAIAANPKDVSPYYDLYQLYLYSYKQDTTAAVDTLEAAAGAFPDDYGPYYMLGQYYLGKEDTVLAKAAFLKAMDRARAAGDAAAMGTVGDALSKLSP